MSQVLFQNNILGEGDLVMGHREGLYSEIRRVYIGNNDKFKPKGGLPVTPKSPWASYAHDLQSSLFHVSTIINQIKEEENVQTKVFFLFTIAKSVGFGMGICMDFRFYI